VPGGRLARAAPAVAVLIAAAAAACSGPRSSSGASEDAPFRGTLLDRAIERIDFTMTDTDGRPFRFRERTRGNLTLLFFGYTNCPDVCPVHMANLGAVIARLPHEVRSRIRVVFVTTDPERDTPDALRAWLDRFDPAFTGLRGRIEDVNRIQSALGLPAAERITGGNPDYAVAHAAQVLAFSPDDSAHVVYPFGIRQADWMHDLPLLLREFPGER
jgi:protein SCO1/2